MGCGINTEESPMKLRENNGDQAPQFVPLFNINGIKANFKEKIETSKERVKEILT